MISDYHKFLEEKSQIGRNDGFAPHWIPDFLFDFQKHLCEWSIRKGRNALFEDCGLGKTPQALVWSQNIVIETNKPVLNLTPLAVSAQTVREGDKFGIECEQSRNGKFAKTAKIIVSNYEQLAKFDPSDFGGVVCDESGILKNFDGVTKEAVTEFMRKIKYRLLCTATPSPNDYIELGTSSEALGDLGYMDMLSRFFKANNGSGTAHGGQGGVFGARGDKNPFQSKFRFRGHAERDFWRWVCSWARAVRKPSDLGFKDAKFKLPKLTTHQHVVTAQTLKDGFLFSVPAVGLQEQREERRRTIKERCERAAGLAIANKGQTLSWVSLNDEGDLMQDMIPDCVQVSGNDKDEFKEETFLAFANGEIKNLVTKGLIAAWGLNFQNCAHQTHFATHSFEQYYQEVRRSWRFGQKNEVRIDMIVSDGDARNLKNLERKALQAEKMFGQLVQLMNHELKITQENQFTKPISLPKW